jgi:hypothetical protein
MNLEVDGIAYEWMKGCERGIKALHVAYHEGGAPALGCLYHSVCFFEVAGDWLFDKDVYARFKEAARYLGVRLRWRGEADRVDAAYERLPVARPLCLSLGCDRARSLLNRVADGYKPALSFMRQRSVYARVLAAKMAHAYNGCS